ncbi:MAG TPA: type II toxin-antitoxin system mRNA interferase toxin, RelE/StbE family [Candidatus Diapherotrites archaeon]|uniref:Type II toxin-antitoxin system mRNA interferase toxin, RelE/StbE family n=1 Tax=Candidatus Iainarchaeum sp. TaxID=3101447 RepID=A0A7J4J5B3_9ARCH|nr:type II toxin-antitoxin system mRNA interferase toxin, RelE/StbE family [Candidatus Diapherotrites archaeon]
MLLVEKACKKKLEKAGAKNPQLRKVVENKLCQILEDPYRFKPLHAPMNNKRRVHILQNFVPVYDIIEESKTVRLLDMDHHDNVYQ